MFKAFWNWFVGPEAEARRLNRDVEYILNSIDQEHYGPIRAQVAADLRKDIDYVVETFIQRDNQNGHRRAEQSLQRMHGEARLRRDQLTLTSLTLAIIYVKANRIGEHGQKARAAIDAFLADWAHQTEEDSGVLPPKP